MPLQVDADFEILFLRLLGGGEHLTHARGVARHRLFHEDVFALLDGLFKHHRAEAGRRREDRHVAQFDRFLRNIELTSSQTEAASTRHTAIRSWLQIDFPGSKTFIVGSYAKNTSIRPPSDLDIFLCLPDSIFTKYNSFAYTYRNAQSELLQEVKSKIQKHYPNTKMKADGQVVVVPFASSFSVEIAPAFAKPFGGYTICDTNNGGKWKDVDPVGEKSALTASNTLTNGNTVRLVKMIKCWQQVCNVPLKSFCLEILAQNFLKNYQHRDKSSVYFDWMIRDFFEYLLGICKSSFYGVTIYHPTTFEALSIGDDWVTKAEMALLRAKKAIEYGEQYPYSALDEWKKIFGDWYLG